MKFQSLFTIIIAQLFCFITLLAQKNDTKGLIEIQNANSLIDKGKNYQAGLILRKIENNYTGTTYAVEAKILSARILNEKGDRLNAIKALSNILALPNVNSNQNIELKVDALLVLGECYYGMSWMERFKTLSDSLLHLSLENNLKPQYRIRAYTNLVRYFNYQVQEDKAQPYLDSAKNLYFKANSIEKTANTTLLLIADIGFLRNTYRYKLFSLIDSIINNLIVAKGIKEKYLEVYLWRVIGNSNLDECSARVDWKLNRKNKHFKQALNSYDNATGILKKYFPSNKIDLVAINNLRGLIYFNCGYNNLAENEFQHSEAILSQNHYSIENYTYTYIDTYAWKLGIIDSICTGEVLFKNKQHSLIQFQELAPYWDKWQEENKNISLDYLRDVYVKSAYEYIVMICYDLYQLKKDPKYIQIAFEAQEKSKYKSLKEKLFGTLSINKSVPTIKEIQNNLSPDEAIISFSDIGSYFQNLHMLVITKDSVSLKRFNILNRKGTDMYFNVDYFLKNIAQFKNTYYHFYNIIFKPILAQLNSSIKHLVVFPSTFSSKFRFGLMLSDTSNSKSFSTLSYISNQYKISYDFSYQILEARKQLQKNNESRTDDLVAFVPDYSSTSFYKLLFFNQSSKYLNRAFDFNVYNNKNSTVSNYAKYAGNASILLLAGHGYSNLSSAEDIKIIMDGSKEGSSSFLAPSDIINTPLKANLTILSLCESGVGDQDVTSGYLNLPYWFSYAGSKSCLYSYWKLDDRSTSFIVERFLHHLAKGMLKSEALWNAKKDYLSQVKSEEEKNPIYWGGLVVIGDDCPINIKEKNYDWYYTLIILPVLVLLYRKRKLMGILIRDHHNLLFAIIFAALSLYVLVLS